MMFCSRNALASLVLRAVLTNLAVSFLVIDGTCAATSVSIPREAYGEREDVTSAALLSVRVSGGMSGNGLTVSPDGRFVAFELHQADLPNNTYRVAWIVAPTMGGETAISVGDGGEAMLFRAVDDNGVTGGGWVPGTPYWSSDSQWIFYRKQVSGEVQIWRSARNGSRSEQLTHNAADVQSLVLSRDETRLLFGTDAPRATRERAREADSEQGYLLDAGKLWSTARSRPFSARYTLTDGRPLIWVFDLKSGTERRATPEETSEYWSIAKAKQELVDRFGRGVRVVVPSNDGRWVAWMSPAYTDKQGTNPPLTIFMSRTQDGVQAIRCAASACTGMFDGGDGVSPNLWWSDDHREIYFIRREGPNYGRSIWYAWQVGSSRVREVFRTTDWISSCTFLHSQAICFREAPNYPRTVVSISLKNGSMKTLVDPNPEFKNLELGEVERLEWSDEHGNSTFGFLVKPVHRQIGTRYPLVIVGYRAKRVIEGGTGNEYPVHALAANGFAVLCYDAPEPWDVYASTKDQKELSARSWGEQLFDVSAALSLLEAAITKLDERGLIDVDRVGITGFSTGAHQANYALVNSKRFAAAVVSQPPFSPMMYYLSGSDANGRAGLRLMGLGPQDSPDGRSWPRLSLALNVDRVRAPVLINSSDFEAFAALETVVKFSEARKPIELFVYPDEYHVKWYPQHRQHIYERNIDWFNFWLRGVVDPDVKKSEQYRRWRSFVEDTDAEPAQTKLTQRESESMP